MNILLIIFNRPQLSAQVFERIRAVKPTKLFIAADGPRTGKSGDKIHVSRAITWFFEHVEEGIILEDDCLPNSSFFSFCTEMLEYYRKESSIVHIDGSNFLTAKEITDPTKSYRFSRCAHVWGWATWKRAWNMYDINMTHLNTLAASSSARSLFSKKKYLDFWIKHCGHIGMKNIDTWDAQWQYSILYNSGIVISPNINMIENIGFGADATHTTSKNTHILETKTLNVPIQHTSSLSVDMVADAKLMDKLYIRNFWQRVLSRIKK